MIEEYSYKNNKIVLNIFTALAVGGISFETIYIIIMTIITKKRYIEIIKVSSGLIFITLGLLFAVSGVATNMRINRYFPDFYKENKWMLIFATMGLSIPLIMRGSLDMLRYYD